MSTVVAAKSYSITSPLKWELAVKLAQTTNYPERLLAVVCRGIFDGIEQAYKVSLDTSLREQTFKLIPSKYLMILKSSFSEQLYTKILSEFSDPHADEMLEALKTFTDMKTVPHSAQFLETYNTVRQDITKIVEQTAINMVSDIGMNMETALIRQGIVLIKSSASIELRNN